MRIKINDKIYRLKEIESGVDSLMELVEEPKYKDGDFVVCEFGTILIFKEADGDRMFDHAYLPSCGELVINKVASYEGVKRHATTEEKKRMIDALAERGKRWNKDKKCIEDIPKRKFKNGDKVTLKSRCISKTGLEYLPFFDKYIGERLEVVSYTESGNVQCNNCFFFHEDWLEPWSDEPKVGDMVIAWNNDMSLAVIGIKIDANPAQGCKHVLNNNNSYKHAIKFDGTKEHLEKIRKG